MTDIKRTTFCTALNLYGGQVRMTVKIKFFPICGAKMDGDDDHG